MTFEHYPFDPCNLNWSNLYDEPQLVRGIMETWRRDGLPRNVPMEITESNLAFDTATEYMQPYAALWLADFVGSFLSAGGRALYYYQWEPLPMYEGCGGWGTFGMFDVVASYNVKQDTSQFFAANLLTQEWVEPGDRQHIVFPASTDITDGNGHVLVTAYAVQRPDGERSVLFINKDQFNSHTLTVMFHNSADNGDHYFEGNVIQVSFGAQSYIWHPQGQNGYANPDGPAVRSVQRGGKDVQYTLPATSITTTSITILRRFVQ